MPAEHHCGYSGCESERTSGLKRCTGCRKVWYCSSRCQQDDWRYHIFDCKAGQPISTVYHLARAMGRDVVPVDPQTRRDYGFEKAEKLLGPASGSNFKLCGLYQGLLHYLGVPLQDVRTWQREGRLLDGIKASFETLPPDNRGGYYAWLLEHPEVLDDSPLHENCGQERVAEQAERMLRNAWRSIGGSPNDTADTIRLKKAAWPATKQDCFIVYTFALDGGNPDPSLSLWLSFGFVAAMDPGEEQEFGRNYQKLVRASTFNELYEAYETSTIPQLFECYNIRFHDPHLFADVMSGSPRTYKSVWNLKHYVDELVSYAGTDEAPTPVNSVRCDYGYDNCMNPSERKLLDDLYKYLLTERQVDPLKMHAACLRGELLEFAKGFMKLAPHTAKYTRLLRNPYPLPDLDGLSIISTRR